MSNLIECICRLLPNRVLITVPTLQNDMTYVVTGIYNLDTDLPTVIVKKNEPEAKATLNVPINLVDSIIINYCENEESKNKVCRN